MNSLNERLGQWLDYLRDMSQLLSIVKRFTWEDDFTWIISDVTRPHSSMPYHLAVAVVLFYLEYLTSLSMEHRLYIADILAYLSHNYFIFDGEFCLEVWGHHGSKVFAVPHLCIGKPLWVIYSGLSQVH